MNSRNPRSTVGTSTEFTNIYYACYIHGRENEAHQRMPRRKPKVKDSSTEDIVNCMLLIPGNTRYTVPTPIRLREDRTLQQQLEIRKPETRDLTVSAERRNEGIDEYMRTSVAGDEVYLPVDRMAASQQGRHQPTDRSPVETPCMKVTEPMLRFYLSDGTTKITATFSTKFETKQTVSSLKSRMTRCFHSTSYRCLVRYVADLQSDRY